MTATAGKVMYRTAARER